jgi:FAD/FMN-containing dehydrogenase/Fe-S oxidoreductase
MNKELTPQEIQELKQGFKGELYFDETHQILYATDASAYREKPLAVALPKDEEDVELLIHFARKNHLSLIPRAAGTSLAGQVVGNGIVVDISKYFTRILEINTEERWVRLQPGVVRDELNLALKPLGLFFGPETSTSNRCMMGGMLGNNACGAHSLVYGSTRDHTLEVTALLSDGSRVVFKSLSKGAFLEKLNGNMLENKIYQHIQHVLSDIEIQQEIDNVFPDPEIERRNTGYALDLLLQSEVFGKTDQPFNFSKLLAGSEGTLAFTTEIKLNLVPLPPPHKALVCVHLHSVEKALKANLIALKYKPVSVELMDKAIMDMTKTNKEQEQNRFFVTGDPGALLIVEFAEEDPDLILQKSQDMEAEMKTAGYGFHFPVVTGKDMARVWNLRKAGLGVLSNMPGDGKPAPVIEDTAVNPKDLPDFIAEINLMLDKYGKSCVYYAHIATGELHLRPVLNLKDPNDVELFQKIAYDTAVIVKKYRGSLSGEHGDGRLRGAFIPLMMGDTIMKVFEEVKDSWDPQYIFNPGKIVKTPPMNTSLRYEGINEEREIETVFRFDNGPGILRAAERCNGSGDCRKSSIIGGTMCPSYQATRNEKNTTRARANILREFLSRSKKDNPFDHQEIYDVLDLCLSCKACKSECPSNVDVTKLKAEFLQHYYDANGIPLRTRMIANITSLSKLAALAPGIYNKTMSVSWVQSIMHQIGFAKERSLPGLYKTTLSSWFKKYQFKQENLIGKVYLFNDEFTNFNDTEIGIKTIQLLHRLGYDVVIPKHLESGRTYLSKGLLRKAKRIAERNVSLLAEMITPEKPLVGIEPSTILTFRDEYPELVDEKLIEDAKKLGKNALTIEEFLAAEFQKGNISKQQFTSDKRDIKLHGHCQQKALSGTNDSMVVLGIPENYSVTEIPSGCCGMAGSFGYEQEHYDLSMKVGEMVLFPAVRNASLETIIAAPGTSCRHQIKDGTERTALHPVEVLYEALV